MPNIVISLKEVEKHYGNFKAINKLNLEIESGRVVTLLGPNGAGKSTTIGIILGLVSTTSGITQILGESPGKISNRLKVGCTPQDSHFPDNLKSIEILKTLKTHYSQPKCIKDLIQLFHLKEFINKKTSQLSGGQKRCLSLACAFLGNPQIIILDEPTVGLDVDVRKSLWKNIKNYTQTGGTVLLTTHYLEEAELISDEIVVINKGTVIRKGTPQEIKKSLGLYEVKFKLNETVVFPKQYAVLRDKDYFRVTTNNSDAFIKEFLTKQNFSDLEISPISLESAFLEIIR